MNDREEWRKRVRDIRAASTIWWWWWWYTIGFIPIFKNICIYVKVFHCANGKGLFSISLLNDNFIIIIIIMEWDIKRSRMNLMSPITMIRAIIWKWKQHGLTLDLSWRRPPPKLNEWATTFICHEVIQNSSTTWGELQKEQQTVGTEVSQETISQTLYLVRTAISHF